MSRWRDSDRAHNPDTVKNRGWRWGGVEHLDSAGPNRSVTLVSLDLERPAVLLVTFDAVPDGLGPNFAVTVSAEIITPRGGLPTAPVTIPLGGAVVIAQTLRVFARVTGGAGTISIMAAPLTGSVAERKV